MPSSYIAIILSKYQKVRCEQERGGGPGTICQRKFIFLQQQKVFIFISPRKLMRRLFGTNCFVDDTVCPAAERKYFFWISLRTKLAELNSKQRWWVPKHWVEVKQVWGEKCCTFHLFLKMLHIFTSCCGRCILRWSPSILPCSCTRNGNLMQSQKIKRSNVTSILSTKTASDFRSLKKYMCPEKFCAMKSTKMHRFPNL